MKKILSLLKASMSYGMNIFNIKIKDNSKKGKLLLPIFLGIICILAVAVYADMFMSELTKVNMGFVMLTLFVLITFILTLVEGIYKSSSLLFNCKDDDLLLSLPIKRRTVLFVRIFKFYIFELLYNSIFMLPAIIVYAIYVPVGITYYIVSLVMILFLPVIPVVISCIIGAFISSFSSKFKFKNIAQIIIITIFLIVLMVIASNLESIIKNLAASAKSLNDIITKLYYPAGAYNKLILDFNIIDLIKFILINIAIFIMSIFILGKFYFKINSKSKTVKTSKHTTKYRVRKNKVMISLIKKEFKKFITSPVFVINAGFGLVLFIVATIAICFKFNDFIKVIMDRKIPLKIDDLKNYIPLILFGLITFATLLSSITSSMISLEGRTLNILRSLPVKSSVIIKSKIYTAFVIIFPFILLGDIILFINFKFSLIQIILLLLLSIVLPLVSAYIGIIVNIKYPKMNAENDTEIVKQSMSSMIAVFAGMGLLGITGYTLIHCAKEQINTNLILAGGLIVYTVILLLLMLISKKSIKEFDKIQI